MKQILFDMGHLSSDSGQMTSLYHFRMKFWAPESALPGYLNFSVTLPTGKSKIKILTYETKKDNLCSIFQIFEFRQKWIGTVISELSRQKCVRGLLKC